MRRGAPPPGEGGGQDGPTERRESDADRTPAVDHDDLLGDAIPQWVIDAVRDRHAGWTRRRGTEAPDVGLIWQWVIDNSGLPAAYRRVLDVVGRLPAGSRWPLETIAERVGVDVSTLRKRWVPSLEAWGWLRVARPEHGSHEAFGWTATCPVEAPPDRVSVPQRSPGKKPGVTGQEARAHRARSPRITGQEARQGEDEGAKVASGARSRVDAASQLDAPDDEHTRFWSVVGMVERREGDDLPTMPRRLRHDLARLIAREVPDTNGDWQTGGDRAPLVLDDLAARSPDLDTIIDLAADSLGVDRDEARRIIHRRRGAS